MVQKGYYGARGARLVWGFTRRELALLKRLTTPQKIQDWLERIPINFEETCMSPRQVMRKRKAHCLEGALFAAAALLVQGERPLLMDLKSSNEDEDHVVAIFRRRGGWGAISKTNHGVLRYREPIYRTLRELALSYFHEYFLNNGRKTLRSYSEPLDLKRFLRRGWTTTEENLWYVSDALDEAPHHPLLGRGEIRGLRPADPIERKMGRLVQFFK